MRSDRLVSCVLAFAGAVALGGCNGLAKLDWTTLGRGTWQRPEDVVRALALHPGDRVADLGAGEGYFVPYLRDAVGPDGRVFAVEIEAERVERLAAEFSEAGNVEAVLGRSEDPQLPDRSIDLVLVVNTYHHIAERPAYFARLRRDLSPSGRVAIIEPDAELRGLLGLFVKTGHESVASEIVEEMGAAGYRPAARHDFLPVQVFEVFAPAADAG